MNDCRQHCNVWAYAIFPDSHHFQVSANGDSMDSGVIGRLGLVDVLNDVLRVALRTVEDDVD